MPTLTFSDTSFPSNTVMILPFSQFLSSFQIFEFSVCYATWGCGSSALSIWPIFSRLVFR